MIYQLVNKRTQILPLATSHIAHLYYQLNHVCTVNISMSRFKSIKRALRTFLFNNFFCETIVKQLWQFFGIFCTNFDSLWPRNRQIFAIIFPFKLRRNAFWTLPNWKDVSQNRSKWLTTAAVEEGASEVPADNRNKPIRKLLTKMLCTEVCNFIFTWKTNWPYLMLRPKPIAQ